MKTTRKLTYSGMLIALGVITGSLFYIPVGVAKAFPIQHVINVISAVLLGPWYAVGNAFCISLLRNILGTGSLLAFPGSMIGALLCGLLYKKSKHLFAAVLGETMGTGIIGAYAAYPIAKYALGMDKGISFFVTPFLLSSMAGALIAWMVLSAFKKVHALNLNNENA